jgi:ATP-binding cassette subfamily B (MDR/TAP) protein 1
MPLPATNGQILISIAPRQNIVLLLGLLSFNTLLSLKMELFHSDDFMLKSARHQAVRQVRSASRKQPKVLLFTTPKQILVLGIAVVTAAIIATGKTVFTVFLGKIFDAAAKYGQGTIGGQDLFTQVSLWCGYLTVLGVGMWMVSSVDMALWIVSGALRAKRARSTLFSVLAQKQMDWFDTREDGMSSFLTQTEG